MATCGDSELTMCDVLEEQQNLEEDAKAVLGDSDDTNCTYDDGYVPRQALYACKTCSTSSESGPGGICLACSYACHENHELVELYTKRKFRCDCGNSRFGTNPCRLCPKKDDLNVENCYNQNFNGLYCICSRPYPDAADDVDDEMIQCIMCEDWFHGRHLGDDLPDHEEYAEMVCRECMDSCTFLYSYKSRFDMERVIAVDDNKESKKAPGEPLVKTETIVNETNANENIKVEADSDIRVDPSITCDVKMENNSDCVQSKDEESINIKLETKVKLDIAEAKIKLEPGNCKLQSELKCVLGPGFFPEDWRKELCRCNSCIQMYKNKSCSFLIDEFDTIQAYEERGKYRNGSESQYDQGLNALSQMDRVKQVEAIHEYNSMKTELKDYLKTFADAKRTVSAKDIESFFEGMQQRKRQRTDNFVPHFCR